MDVADTLLSSLRAFSRRAIARGTPDPLARWGHRHADLAEAHALL